MRASTVKETVPLWGEPREVTVVFPSDRPVTCTITGASLPAGSAIAYHREGKQTHYLTWPLPASAANPRQNKMAEFAPDKYKLAWAEQMSGSKHVLVNALAGSGKTRGLVYCFGQLEKTSACCMSFDTNAAAQLKELLPNWVKACTTHSEALAALRKKYGCTPDLNKLRRLLSEVVADESMHWSIEELVGKAKAEAVRPGEVAKLKAIIDYYSIHVRDDSIDYAIESADEILRRSMDVGKYSVDFDDMIWLAAITDVPLERYNEIGIDEVQDLSVAQRMLLKKFADRGARITAVGDPNQALYLFRGATADSFDRMRDMLTDSRGVTEVGLPVNYRCDRSIIELAQRSVADIQAHDGAASGLVTQDLDFNQMMSNFEEGDAIVCRTNAPLFQVALELARSNRKFKFKAKKEAGRMIGKILWLAGEDFGPKTQDVSTVLKRLDTWEQELAGRTQSAYRLANVKDRNDVIRLMSRDVSDVRGLIKQIDTVFSGYGDGVTLSSIHGAKGREWKRVWALRPDLLPHKMAKTDDEKRQEKNAWYVLVTRAKNELHLVQGEAVEQKKAV